MAVDVFGLEEAEEEIADLRGKFDVINEHFETSVLIVDTTLTVNGAATVTGALTATGGTSGTPTLIKTDSWHTLGALTHFTVQVGRYRLTPHNEVQIDIEVTAGGANSTTETFANALPAAYRPNADRHLALASNRNVTAADTWPRLFVNSTTGDVQVVSQASTSAILGGTWQIPLD